MDSKPIIFPFPFGKIPRDSTVAIYGAGSTADDYVRQILQENWCNILYIADKDYQKISQLHNTDVYSPDKLADHSQYDYVIISSLLFAFEMKANIKKMGIPDEKVICEVPYGIKSYTLCGEDIIVYTILKLTGKEKLSYIDLGANDPYVWNNTAFLYVHGGRGILVEPNPDLSQTLKDSRPEDIVLNVGVASEAGTLSYYMFENNLFNTFSDNRSKGAEFAGHELIKTLEIPLMTLTEIIDTYAGGIYPEFLSIDIEDMDYDVLKSCNFSKSSPLVICVEVTNCGHTQMTEMLDEKGFLPFHNTWRNVIYVKKDLLK